MHNIQHPSRVIQVGFLAPGPVRILYKENGLCHIKRALEVFVVE